MNSAVRRLILFFFSIATLAACDDPNEIGLELQEGNQIGTEFTDTITIHTGTVLLTDSISSFRLNPSLAGIYADPLLGTVEATAYTEVGVGSSNFTTGTLDVATLKLDSLVLSLDYTSIYGIQGAPLQINVHELVVGKNNEGGFSNTVSYFTNTTLPYDTANLLGTETFFPLILKKKNSNADSAVLVNIKLNNTFAQRLLSQPGKGILSSQQSFNSFLKGIALTSYATAPASIVGFNFNSTASAMRLYYKIGDETEQRIHVFPMSGNEVRNFYGVKANRAGTTLASLTSHGSHVPASATGDETFVQSNTQLLTKITFPYLHKFKEQKGNIIVNRAELILPVKLSSNSILPSHPTMVLYQAANNNLVRRNRDGLPVAVQQEGTYSFNTTNYPAPVEYDAKKGHYRLNMTSYVQGVIHEAAPNYSLLLSTGNSVITGGQFSERQIFQEPRPYRTIISNTQANPVKLLIYYSKLN